MSFRPPGSLCSVRPTHASCATILVLAVFILSGCSGQDASSEFSTFDVAADQWAIAIYHSQQATRLQHKAEELSARLSMYEQLFVAESEWL